MKIKLLTVGLLFILLYSCKHDSEIPKPICDLSNITFAKDIKPIIDQHCISCHNDSTGQIFLGDYESIKKTSDHSLIIDGDTVDLVKSVMHLYTDSLEGKNMPYVKLDDCSINKIKSWVDDGTPNN